MLFNALELIWIRNWDFDQLVENALYHLNGKYLIQLEGCYYSQVFACIGIEWMDQSTKENVGHLLASMHLSIKEHDESNSDHLNNLTYTKFVEK